MEREGFNAIKIVDIQVENYDGNDTFYFISDTKENEYVLNQILHQNKFEIKKKKDEDGLLTVWLYFPIPNYIILLNETKPIEKVKGYEKILNDSYKFFNTMIWEYDQVPLTNFHQKINVDLFHQ